MQRLSTLLDTPILPRILTPALVLLLALASAPAGPAHADVLLLDGIEAESGTPARPVRGMSMQAVEQRFGNPQTRIAAVGEPPISRWEYPEFIVYFEHSLVIHAARKRARD